MQPASAATGSSSAPYLPYTADSFFRTPVVGAVEDTARSAAFRSFMKTHPDQKKYAHPRITGLGSNPWGTTFHLASASDPVWKLAGPGVRKETTLLGSQGVHISDDVLKRIPTGTQDREMLIVDPIFGYSVFVADCVPNYTTRTITCSSSGVTWHASNGLDRRNPRSSDKRNFTSRGRISDAGVIRPDLLQHGIANDTGLGHVLQFWFVETLTSDGFCHPMIGQEKGKYGFGAEGERVGIRRDVDLKARGFTGAALVIARTLQQHGAYIGDNSGSSTMLKGAQATATYNPYAGMNVSQDCLKGLTWDDFVVYRR
ncbi:MAG TPA: hypothetical protein VFG72_01170 [Marmoricola sp.]|nr:hypothetical protein [Marmoricola sp.]